MRTPFFSPPTRRGGLVLAAVLALVGCGGPPEELLADAGYDTTTAALVPGALPTPQPGRPVQVRVSTAPLGLGAVPPTLQATAPQDPASNTGLGSDTSPDPIPARGGDGSPDNPATTASAPASGRSD